MLIETPGGFDYTAPTARGWMQEAGFQQTRVEHLVGPDSMVIGINTTRSAHAAPVRPFTVNVSGTHWTT